MIIGILGIFFIITEINNIKKASAMVLSDFPNLSPTQLEDKRHYMKLSAWLVIGCFLFAISLGNLIIMLSPEVGYCVVVSTFVLCFVTSAVFGSKAKAIK